MDEVIKDICKIKFGDGYLSAEPKNNKEDDMVKGPEDIDPLTLYVGNLAQEVDLNAGLLLVIQNVPSFLGYRGRCLQSISEAQKNRYRFRKKNEIHPIRVRMFSNGRRSDPGLSKHALHRDVQQKSHCEI